MNTLASLMNLAGPDMIIVLLIVLILFGAKRLPELARGMGQAVKEFQKGKDNFVDELHRSGTESVEVRPAASTTPLLDRTEPRATASSVSSAEHPAPASDQTV